MGSIMNGNQVSKLAKVDLRAHQYRFVKLGTDDLVDICGVAEQAYGVLLNIPNIGENAEVACLGETQVEAVELIAANVLVAPDADGKAITATTNDFVRGICTKASTGAGMITIRLMDSYKAL